MREYLGLIFAGCQLAVFQSLKQIFVIRRNKNATAIDAIMIIFIIIK